MLVFDPQLMNKYEEIIVTPHPALSLKGRGVIKKSLLCKGLFYKGGWGDLPLRGTKAKVEYHVILQCKRLDDVIAQISYEIFPPGGAPVPSHGSRRAWPGPQSSFFRKGTNCPAPTDDVRDCRMPFLSMTRTVGMSL